MGVFVLFGLGYASVVLVPLVLLIPFILPAESNRTRLFSLLIGTVTVLVATIPLMYLALYLTSFTTMDNSNGALDGTGLAFFIYSLGAGASIASCLALWFQWLFMRRTD